jgi:hypothetical protein
MSEQRSGCVTAIMLLFGAILLLPGLCALLFGFGALTGKNPDPTLLTFVLFGLAIGFAGIMLIRNAIRGPRDDDFATPARARMPQIQLTKHPTTHCFLAFSEYIAPQRVKVCPVPLAGLPFWGGTPFRFPGLSTIPGVPAIRRDRAHHCTARRSTS